MADPTRLQSDTRKRIEYFSWDNKRKEEEEKRKEEGRKSSRFKPPLNLPFCLIIDLFVVLRTIVPLCMHVWRSDDKFQETVVNLHQMGSRNGTIGLQSW